MSRLAARYRRAELEREAAECVRKAVVDGEPVVANPRALPLDRERLRGIPAVGRLGGGGAIRGTTPHFDAIEKLSRQGL